MSCDKTPTTGKYTLADEARTFEVKRAHKSSSTWSLRSLRRHSWT
jgi:hypothetical protein